MFRQVCLLRTISLYLINQASNAVLMLYDFLTLLFSFLLFPILFNTAQYMDCQVEYGTVRLKDDDWLIMSDIIVVCFMYYH